MLLLLSLIILIFVLLSYFGYKKDSLSPLVMFFSVFFVCSILAFWGNIKWGVFVGPDIVVIIISSFGFMYLGMKSACFFSKKNISEKYSFTITCEKKIPFSFFYTLLFCLAQIIILYLYNDRLLFMAESIGYTGEDLQKYVRLATVVYGMHVGVWYAVFVPAISVCSIIFFYMWAERKINGFSFFGKDIILFIPFFISFVSSAISGARSGMIEIFFMASYLYLFLYVKKHGNINVGRLIVGSFFLLILLSIIFLLFGTLTRKVDETNVLSSLLLYGGSSIVAFNSWVNVNDVFDAGFVYNILGEESFSGVRNTLNNFFPMVQSSSPFLDFVTFPDGSKSNIYTAFRSYIKDFGIVGNVFICYMLGFLFTLVYEKMRSKTSPFTLILYSYFLESFLYGVFTPSITSGFFTPSQFFWLIWFLILGRLIMGTSFYKTI